MVTRHGFSYVGASHKSFPPKRCLYVGCFEQFCLQALSFVVHDLMDKTTESLLLHSLKIYDIILLCKYYSSKIITI